RAGVEKFDATVGGCALALAAPDRRASWRSAIRFTGQSENSRSDGAPLHRQSRRAAGNVRGRLHHRETVGGAHFRPCSPTSRKFGGAARKISDIGVFTKVGRSIILSEGAVSFRRGRFCRSRSQ